MVHCVCVCVCLAVPSAVGGLAASSDNPSSVVVTWMSPGGHVKVFSLSIVETSSDRCQRVVFIICPPVTCLQFVVTL